MNSLEVTYSVLSFHLKITAELEEGIQKKEEITALSEISITKDLAHKPTSRFQINMQKY